MKNLLFAGLAVVLMLACKNQSEAPATSGTEVELPYKLERPHPEWQIGKTENVKVVMDMLKAWESKDLAACATFFGDSAELGFDYYHEKLPHDSLAAFLESGWADLSSVKVEMEDWESVISKDQKHEWVTLWYKQINTHLDGKVDSINLINDAKIKDGKIVIFSEYGQHFPEAQ